MKLLTNSVRFSTPWNAWNMVRVGWSCGPWSWSVSATFFWWSTAAPTSLSTASCAPSSGRRQAKCWGPSQLAKGPIGSVFLGKRATEAADCKGFIPIVPTETTLPVFTICLRLQLTHQGLPIQTLGPKTLIMLPPPSLSHEEIFVQKNKDSATVSHHFVLCHRPLDLCFSPIKYR